MDDKHPPGHATLVARVVASCFYAVAVHGGAVF